MTAHDRIPVFALFGETEPFPDIVHVERISDRAQGHGWIIAPHRHQRMAQILLVAVGRAVARLDDRTHRMRDGAFLYLPPGIVHGFEFAPDTEGVVLSIPVPVLASLGPAREEIERHLARPLQGRDGEAIAPLVARLQETLSGSGRFRTAAALGLTQAILASLAEVAAAGGRPDGIKGSRIAELDRLIAEHIGEGWRAGDFAAALGVTTGQLSRICRAAAGVGSRAYIDAAIMTEAARNLVFTRLPVAEIGYRLGFTDPTHFSRRFRIVVGMTPSDYRRNMDAGVRDG